MIVDSEESILTESVDEMTRRHESVKLAVSLLELADKARQQEDKHKTQELPRIEDDSDNEDIAPREMERREVGEENRTTEKEALEIRALKNAIEAVNKYVTSLEDKPIGDPFWQSETWQRQKADFQLLKDQLSKTSQRLMSNALGGDAYQRRKLQMPYLETMRKLQDISIRSGEIDSPRVLHVIVDRLRSLKQRIEDTSSPVTDSEEVEVIELLELVKKLDVNKNVRIQELREVIWKLIKEVSKKSDQMMRQKMLIDSRQRETREIMHDVKNRYWNETQQQFMLPENISTEQIQADYEKVASRLGRRIKDVWLENVQVTSPIDEAANREMSRNKADFGEVYSFLFDIVKNLGEKKNGAAD